MHKVTIIGSGLAGCMLGLLLAKRGYSVEIYEARADLRGLPINYGRSINLALSKRGITALEQCGLMNEVESCLVPMKARTVHEKNGEIHYQFFGRNESEYINAISRSDLNNLLLNAVDNLENISVKFEHALESIDFNEKKIFLRTNEGCIEVAYERLIGADGAASKVRENLSEHGYIQASRSFLPHGYKELTIPKEYADKLPKERLHLWPRKSFMLLGNPNLDESITGTLFMQLKGDLSFDAIQSEAQIKQLFNEEFNDVYASLNTLVEEYQQNPIGNLSSITCSPWYYQDQCLILGDAAHGIVPFFGQGMNCAFEDCRILVDILDGLNHDWGKSLPKFFQQRKLNTDAIAKMSMQNYHEIQEDVSDSSFILRKSLAHELMQRYPQHYVSKHVMVMFTNLPYALAYEAGELQNAFLNEICSQINHIEEVNWKIVEQKLKNYDENLAVIYENYK
jgi:kynurenine 3-monooxygenase